MKCLEQGLVWRTFSIIVIITVYNPGVNPDPSLGDGRREQQTLSPQRTR